MWDIQLTIIILAVSMATTAQTQTSPATKHSQSCVGHKTFVTCGLHSEEKSVVRVRDVLYGQSPTCGHTPRHCVVRDGGYHPCTGVQSCVFNTPTRDIQHCGASNYLKISYQCIKASLLRNICSDERRTTSPRGYLVTPGYPGRLALRPDRRCVTTIVQPRGWTIRVYLTDFGREERVPGEGDDSDGGDAAGSSSQEADAQCEQEVTFRDVLPRQKGYLPQVSLCLTPALGRDALLYESASSVMQLAFFTTSNGVSADKMGAMFFFEGLGPGMKPSLVTKAPLPIAQPIPTLSPTPAPPPREPPTTHIPPYYPVSPPPSTLPSPRDPMLMLPGQDIDMATFSPKFVHRTTLPPTFHISNTTGPLFRGFDVYYTDDNLTYFDDLVDGDDDGGSVNDKWASIVGGTMFALAMMMLVGILLIMVVEKRKARKRHEAGARGRTTTLNNNNNLPHLEAQTTAATTPKLHGGISLDQAKAERRNLYKMYRAHSNGGFSSDGGGKYEGIYRKGRYWDKATETDTSSIEGDTRVQVYEEYANPRESTTDPDATDSNGNLTGDMHVVHVYHKDIDRQYIGSGAPGRASKVGFHSALRHSGRQQRRRGSANHYETAVSVNDMVVGGDGDPTNHHRHHQTAPPSCGGGADSRTDLGVDANTYDSVYDTEPNNNNLMAAPGASSESLTTVSNIDGHSSIYQSNNSMFGSAASLGSLWEERSKGRPGKKYPGKVTIPTAPKITTVVQFERTPQPSCVDKDRGCSPRDNQYEAAKAYWKSRNRGGNQSSLRRSSNSLSRTGSEGHGEGHRRSPPSTLPKPDVSAVKPSPGTAAKVRQSPSQHVRSSPSQKMRSSPSQKIRSSPRSRSRADASNKNSSVLQRRPSPRASPARARSSPRSRSPHSTKSGASPRSSRSGASPSPVSPPAAGRRVQYEDETPGVYHAEEPELSSYSIHYARSDFKRSLPKFANSAPKRPMARPPPPPVQPPPKPTTQKPCLKPKPGPKSSPHAVSRSTEDIYKGRKPKPAGKKSKGKDFKTSKPSEYIYDGGASLGGSYRSLNSMDTVDPPSNRANGHSNGRNDGRSNGNRISGRSDDDLEIVDNDIYPDTDFKT